MTVVASNFERKANELYETEEWATRALLRVIPPIRGMRVWEPAAGGHKMAVVLREAGAEVFTSDIETYGPVHDATYDFLGEALPYWPAACGAIITNPPYGRGNRDAVRFARKALERCDGWVALLLTAKFDSGKTRIDLHRDNPRFWGKVVLLDRIQWFEGDHGGTEDHAWYIWCPAKGAREKRARLFYEGRDA